MCAIPEAIIVKSMTSNFSAIATDVPDTSSLKVGEFVYIITITDILSKCNKYYTLAEYSSAFKYDYVCEQADNIVRVIGKKVNIYKAVKEDDHTTVMHVTDYSSDNVHDEHCKKLKANLIEE